MQKKDHSTFKSLVVAVLITVLIIVLFFVWFSEIINHELLVSLFVVLILLFGFWRIHHAIKIVLRYRFFHRNQEINASQMVNSIGKFCGVIKNIQDTIKINGIIDNEVVWYKIVARSVWKRKSIMNVFSDFPSDSRFGFREIFESTPFFVENETGKVLVNPAKAHVSAKENLRERFAFNGYTSLIRNYILYKKPNIAQFLKYEARVTSLSLNEKVCIMGEATVESDQQGNNILVFSGDTKNQLIITVGKNSFNYVVFFQNLFLGFLFILLGVYIFSTFFVG